MTDRSRPSAASRRRSAIAFAALFGLALVGFIAARGRASDAGSTLALAPDYSLAATWICRPGAEDVCTTGLDTAVVDARGNATPAPFSAAADPAIDCFYVYPTVSKEQTEYADLQPTPEVVGVTKAQVGRLSSRCRVFAPIYRQQTIYGLRRRLGGAKSTGPEPAFDDISAAWSYYLAHDNHGRGVVLVGHSQGTILLQRLVASTIDGTAQQKLLVSAFLAGDPSLAVPAGKLVGGTFAHVPVCSSVAEIGCVYVWGSYLDDDKSLYNVFGEPLQNGMTSACENPAAPGGGAGALKFFRSKPTGAPVTDPPWIEALDHLTGTCRASSAGNSFIVSVLPGVDAGTYTSLLHDGEIAPGWGLHLYDVGLVQGNILDVLDAEIAAWSARRH